MASTKETILTKTRALQELTAKGHWEELIEVCCTPNADLSHFASSQEPLEGSDTILEFFKSNSSGYSLNLQYTVVELGATACLISGVGSVNNGAWCPFVERWARIGKDWFIVEDKVYEPESWMK